MSNPGHQNPIMVDDHPQMPRFVELCRRFSRELLGDRSIAPLSPNEEIELELLSELIFGRDCWILELQDAMQTLHAITYAAGPDR
jgi:hypothetical protein